MRYRPAHPKTCLILPFLLCLFAYVPACDSKPEPPASTETESTTPEGFDQIATLNGSVSYTLADGEAMHRDNPDTYWIPPRERRENLKKDDLVKLVFDISDGTKTQGERMWVIVTGGDRHGYTGILDNDPYSTDQIKAGLELTFKPNHVIDIYEPEIAEEENN